MDTARNNDIPLVELLGKDGVPSSRPYACDAIVARPSLALGKADALRRLVFSVDGQHDFVPEDLSGCSEIITGNVAVVGLPNEAH